VLDHIAHGEEIEADDRYLTHHRGRWHTPECRSTHAVLSSYLSKNRPHVVLDGSVPLNTRLVVEPLSGVGPHATRRAFASDYVAESVREEPALRSRRWELEPLEPRDLLVPWPYSQASGT